MLLLIRGRNYEFFNSAGNKNSYFSYFAVHVSCIITSEAADKSKLMVSTSALDPESNRATPVPPLPFRYQTIFIKVDPFKTSTCIEKGCHIINIEFNSLLIYF